MKKVIFKDVWLGFIDRIKHSKLAIVAVIAVIGAIIGAFHLSKYVLVIALIAVAASLAVIYLLPKPTLEVSGGVLTINSMFYGKTVPVAEINTDGIRQLNLLTDKDYDVRIRTNGIGLPNYYVGWMRLNNGNKALAYLTGKKSVVLIPAKGYDILISTDDFNEIRAAFSL
jgi:hypothetical protein